MNDFKTELLTILHSPELVQQVVTMYEEPVRKYHTLNHIERIFNIAEVNDMYLTPAQQWAIIFHDIVYDPTRFDNERKSADFAIIAVKKYLIETMSLKKMELVLNHLEEMIMATAKHTIDQSGLDEETKEILDLDLFDLGTDHYFSNARLIALEYRHLPLQTYIEGRLRFIESMLKRNNLYYTDGYFNMEEAARKNLLLEQTVLTTLV
jgi:predicted metal-dependent HD superfamily phosphohydrolase